MFFNGMNHDENTNQQGSSQGYISNTTATTTAPYDDENQEAKRVLFVRHLDFNELKITMIYNLFSNYGNIVKIIFMKQKR